MQGHLTKTIAVIPSILCVMASFGGAAGHVTPNRAFDEYGPICWENEKARLDNFAIGLLNMPDTTLGHIIVYDGKRACRGEAITRAIRAKKYLVEFRNLCCLWDCRNKVVVLTRYRLVGANRRPGIHNRFLFIRSVVRP